MRYVVKSTPDWVMYDIRFVSDDYILTEDEKEITPQEAVSIPIPCKLIDGEYVPAMAPDNSVESDEPEPTPDPEPESDLESRVSALEAAIAEGLSLYEGDVE